MLCGNCKLEKEATADTTKLIDSVNNSSTISTIIQPGKELRNAVTSTSILWQFWKAALLVLESMSF